MTASKAKSAASADERTVTVGSTTYPVSGMGADSRRILAEVDMTDTHIRDLEARLSIARTARAKYIQTLKESLEKS